MSGRKIKTAGNISLKLHVRADMENQGFHILENGS